jgi:hypothetical protein
VNICKEEGMNSIGAWGAFQLGGIIGCSIGIICIWTAALPVFVAVGAAMIIWALAAFAIHAVDAGTAGLNNQLSGAVVRSSTDFVKTTTGKVVTGVAIAGLVTTAAVAREDLTPIPFPKRKLR